MRVRLLELAADAGQRALHRQEVPILMVSFRFYKFCTSRLNVLISDDDEEVAEHHREVILRRLHAQTGDPEPRSVRPPISRLPTGISASGKQGITITIIK